MGMRITHHIYHLQYQKSWNLPKSNMVADLLF